MRINFGLDARVGKIKLAELGYELLSIAARGLELGAVVERCAVRMRASTCCA